MGSKAAKAFIIHKTYMLRFVLNFFACRDTVLNPSEVNDFLLIEMIEK